jgi:WD40 repeat protein
MARPSSRTKIIAVAASIAALLIGTLIFMLVRSGRPRALDMQIGFINSIAFSPDGRQLAITGSDGTGAQLWDSARGKWLRTLNSYSNTDWVAFSPDGHMVATWGAGHVVILWDPPSGNQIRVLGDDAASLGASTFSPDGRQLVTDAFGNDGGLQLWDAASGTKLRRFPGYVDPVFSPDGKFLAAWNKSKSISLLDVASGNEVRTFPGYKAFLVPDVVFSPDGRLLASTNENAVVTVWDLASGNEVRRINDAATVRGIAFSTDSRQLASGSEDHTIKLWDVASGNKVRTLTGHSDAVNCVQFSPDGRMLASGGADGKVFLWPLPQSR